MIYFWVVKRPIISLHRYYKSFVREWVRSLDAQLSVRHLSYYSLPIGGLWTKFCRTKFLPKKGMHILNIHRPHEIMGNPSIFRRCGNMKINPFSSSVLNIVENIKQLKYWVNFRISAPPTDGGVSHDVVGATYSQTKHPLVGEEFCPSKLK